MKIKQASRNAIGRFTRIALSITFASVAMTGCLPPPRNGPFTLPDGQFASLSPAGMAQRRALNPAPVAAVLPVYHPIRCEYEEWDSSRTGPVTVSRMTIVIEPVMPDRLFVRKLGGTGDGTMLMDKTGKELDLNMLDFDNSQRMTPEQAAAVAEKRKSSPTAILTGKHLLAEFIEIPHFLVKSARPGDRVADATMEKGDMWGSYIYRGMVQVGAVRGELFDIVRTLLSTPGVRGYIVMDPENALPLLTDFNFGTGRSRDMRLQRCVPLQKS